MKAKLTYILLLLFAVVFTFSCSSDGGGGSPSGSGNLTVEGKVVNENNVPVSGATVTSGTATATTGADGEFVLNKAPFSERSSITVSAPGFFNAYRGFEPINGQAATVNVMMVSKGTPVTFNADAGATLTNQGGNVTIGQGSLADADGNPYSGTVKAYLRFQNPSQENFGQIMQGGDFAGVNNSDQTGVLSSYGYYSIELEDAAGQPLNIKTGSEAGFTMPITSAQSSTAPATVKLWSFDRETAMWKEEGTATRNGNQYVGQVSHFSEWNCDDWSTTAKIKGKIVCDGAPEVNVKVTVKNGANRLVTYTGSKGEFSIKLPSGFDVTVEIDGLTTFPVSALNANQVYDMGTIDKCAGPSIGEGTFSIGTYTENASLVVCTTQSGLGYQISGVSANGSSQLSVVFATMPSPGTYSVIDWGEMLSSGQAQILAIDGRVMMSPVQYWSTGGGQVSVTSVGGKLKITFSNVPVEHSIDETPETVSGSLKCN